MKIAILTSGILPIPAVQGGAVENLIDFYLEYNNLHKLHDITIYSIYHPHVCNHSALLSSVNHYHYIDVSSLLGRIKRRFFFYIQKFKGNGYYNHFIEYYFTEAYKHIKKQNYDIIMMENRPSYVLKLKKGTKSIFICHLHNELLNSNTLYGQEIYNSLDRIITVSNYISKSVKTINPDDRKCVTIYNGINLQSFRPNRNSTIKREEIGLKPEDFVLVFSGRMNHDKGILELIKAMLLLKNRRRIKLLVIGGSFFGNDIQENTFILNLKELAIPIQNNILFTGFIPYNEMPDYLMISDVAIIPSIWNDPFPTTVLEAQAIGLPIITTNNGGIPEEVTRDNAIILDTNELFIESLARSISWCYDHPEELKRMSQHSLIHSKYFDKERFAKDLFDVFKEISEQYGNNKNCLSK